MGRKAAVVVARQEIGWGEFARLVTMARDSAEDGVTAHSLTKVGLRSLQMDLEAIAAAVGAAITDAEGVEPDDEIITDLREAGRERDRAWMGDGS
jgi:hypothetical protein